MKRILKSLVKTIVVLSIAASVIATPVALNKLFGPEASFVILASMLSVSLFVLIFNEEK